MQKILEEKKEKQKKLAKEKRYEFSYSIETDGVGCSILFEKEKTDAEKYNDEQYHIVLHKLGQRAIALQKDKRGEQLTEQEEQDRKYEFPDDDRKILDLHNKDTSDTYIHQVDEEEREKLLKRKIVSCDPGKVDLLYFTSTDHREELGIQKCPSHDAKTLYEEHNQQPKKEKSKGPRYPSRKQRNKQKEEKEKARQQSQAPNTQTQMEKSQAPKKGKDKGKDATEKPKNGKHGISSLRYTQRQSVYEKHQKGTKKKRTNLRKTKVKGINKNGVEEEKSVIEWEKELAVKEKIVDFVEEFEETNRKTMDIEDYKNYVVNKLRVNNIVRKVYENIEFRKFRWHTQIHTQYSESNLVNRFREKFGDPSNVVIVLGDWGQHCKTQLKNMAPTKGKGFRKLFRRAGYQVFLVDEHYTSKRCFNCKSVHGECKTFHTKKNPNKNNDKVVHGLLRCSNCQMLWNRNRNGALNILWIALCALQGSERPEYLTKH